MRRVGRALWWAGPYIGLGFFVWRQQSLEATLSTWLQAANEAIQTGVGRLTDAATDAADAVD